MTKHFSFTDVVNGITESGWGNKQETPDDAAKVMMDDIPKLSAYALVEILKRMNAIAAAAGATGRSKLERKLEITDESKPFPDKQIGDKVYRCDLDEGAWELVIVGKNKDGMCIVMHTDFDLDYPPNARIASKNMFASSEEAISDAAKRDLAWHEPKLQFAKDALAAIEAGDDLSRFVDGLSSALS